MNTETNVTNATVEPLPSSYPTPAAQEHQRWLLLGLIILLLVIAVIYRFRKSTAPGRPG